MYIIIAADASVIILFSHCGRYYMLVHHVKYCSYVHVCELYTDCLKEPELGDQKPRLLYNGDIVHKEECPE